MQLRMARGRTAPLTIQGNPILTATQGSPYAGFTVSQTGGTAPFTYSVLSGTLPTGITLNSTTGVVAGTPTTAGAFSSIVLRVTDGLGHTSDLAAFSVTVSAAGGLTMPATSTLNLGVKTRRRHRAYDCQSTGGTLTITSDPSGLFAVYSNKLAIAGTQDAAPPALVGPYTVVVNNGTDSSTVTINIVANAYSVGTKAELDYVRALQLILGETIYLASGSYNETNTDWRPGLGLPPTGTFNGSNWVTYEGEVKNGPLFYKCGPDGQGFTNHYLRFKKIKFVRPNLGGEDPQATGQLQLQNGIKFIRADDCLFQGVNSSTVANNVSGIVSHNACSDLSAVNCQFDGLNNGTTIYGPRAYIASNVFTNIWEDCVHAALQYDSDYLLNVMYDKKYYPIPANAGPHGDFFQIDNNTLAAGTYTGSRFIGNRMHRGNGQAGYIDGAGIIIEAGTGVIQSGVRIQENLVVGTAAGGFNVTGLLNAEISFNSLVQDTTTGITEPTPGTLPPTITLRTCNGGNIRYNASAAAMNQITSAGAPAITTPYVIVNQAAQSSAYTAPFQGTVASIPALTAAYAYKAGGPTDKANAGGPYNTGFNSNGFVDWTAGVISLPF